MIRGKKGINAPEGVVIAIVIAIVWFTIIQAVMFVLAGGASDATGDRLCTDSNRFTAKGGVFKNLAPDFIRPTGNICPTQFAVIIPDDFSACDSRFETEFNAGIRQSAMKKCTAQQVADLMHRCWVMGGQGTLDPDSWVCFNVHIKEPKQEGYKDIGQMKREIRRDVISHLDCEQAPDEDLCEEDVEVIVDLSFDRITQNSIIDFYAGLERSSLELCLPEEADDLDEDDIATCGEDREGEIVEDCDNDGVNNEFDQCPDTKPLDSFFVGATGCAANDILGFVEEELSGNPTKQQYADALAPWIQENEALCGDSLIANLNVSHIKIPNSQSVINIQIDPEIRRIVQQHTSVDELPIILESLHRFSAGLPKVGDISRNYMIDIMQNTVNEATGNTYCEDMPCDENFDLDLELRARSLYEIGYCDPPSAIGSGFVGKCKNKLVGDQGIVIAPADTGIGVRGSPYPDVCELLTIDVNIFSEDPDDENVEVLSDACRNVIRGAVGD